MRFIVPFRCNVGWEVFATIILRTCLLCARNESWTNLKCPCSPHALFIVTCCGCGAASDELLAVHQKRKPRSIRTNSPTSDLLSIETKSSELKFLFTVMNCALKARIPTFSHYSTMLQKCMIVSHISQVYQYRIIVPAVARCQSSANKRASSDASRG